MVKKWSDEETLSLIELYRDRPNLWDSSHRDYKEKNKRHDGFMEIAVSFGVDKDEVERKIRRSSSEALSSSCDDHCTCSSKNGIVVVDTHDETDRKSRPEAQAEPRERPHCRVQCGRAGPNATPGGFAARHSVDASTSRNEVERSMTSSRMGELVVVDTKQEQVFLDQLPEDDPLGRPEPSSSTYNMQSVNATEACVDVTENGSQSSSKLSTSRNRMKFHEYLSDRRSRQTTEDQRMSNPGSCATEAQEPHYYLVPNPRRRGVPKVTIDFAPADYQIVRLTSEVGTSTTELGPVPPEVAPISSGGSSMLATSVSSRAPGLVKYPADEMTLTLRQGEQMLGSSSDQSDVSVRPVLSTLTPRPLTGPDSAEQAAILKQPVTREQYDALIQQITLVGETLQEVVRDVASLKADVEILNKWTGAGRSTAGASIESRGLPSLVSTADSSLPPTTSRRTRRGGGVMPQVVKVPRTKRRRTAMETSLEEEMPAGYPRPSSKATRKPRLVLGEGYQQNSKDPDTLPTPLNGHCSSCYLSGRKLHGGICETCRSFVRRWADRVTKFGYTETLPVCAHPVSEPLQGCQGCIIEAYVLRYNKRHPKKPHRILPRGARHTEVVGQERRTEAVKNSVVNKFLTL